MRIEEIGDRIKRQRRKLGLAQHELAALMNVSPQAVSKWERGRCAPDISLIPSLASALDLTTDQLLGYGMNSSSTKEGSVFAGRFRIPAEALRTMDPEHLAIRVNTLCFNLTEHLKKNGGMPLPYGNGYYLGVFTGERHRERAFVSAAATMRLVTSEEPFSVGLSSGRFFLGMIGHPDYARIYAVGLPMLHAARASDWAEERAVSKLAVTSEFVKLPSLVGKLKGPEVIRIDGENLSLFEARVS